MILFSIYFTLIILEGFELKSRSLLLNCFSFVDLPFG